MIAAILIVDLHEKLVLFACITFTYPCWVVLSLFQRKHWWVVVRYRDLRVPPWFSKKFNKWVLIACIAILTVMQNTVFVPYKLQAALSIQNKYATST
jgi:hypothetical protein